MLHAGLLRSPVAHARITGVDVSAARGMPGVIAVFTGADFAAEQGSLPCAWPVTEDMVLPDHPPIAVDEVRYAGEPWPSSWPATAYEARGRARGDRRRLRDAARCARHGGRGRRGRGPRAPRSWHQPQSLRTFDSSRPARATTSTPPSATPQSLARAHLPAAAADPRAMEPRAVVLVRRRRRVHHVVRHADPAHPAAHAGDDAGIPEHKLRVIAPMSAAVSARKLQVTAEEVDLHCCSPGGSASRQVDRVAQRGQRGRAPRPRPDPAADARRRRATARITRPQGRPARRHGRLPACWSRPAYRCSARSCSTASTRWTPTTSPAPASSPTKLPTDAYRGAGRPEATFAVERMMDELAAELSLDPLELRAPQLDHARGVPLRHRRGPDLRLRQLRGRHRAGAGVVRLRRAAARAGRAPRAATTRCSSASACPPSPRCAAWPRRGCSARWPTALAAGSMRRSGCCPPARSRSSPARPPHGQGHETAWSQIVADQLGVPFEDVEVLHGDTQTSPQRHGHIWVPIAGGWWDRGRERREKVIDEGQAHRGAPDGVRGGRPRVRRADGSACTAAPTRPSDHPDVALAVFAAHDLPEGVEPTLDSDATYDPDNFSFPHGTHLCAAEVDTETGFGADPLLRSVDDIGHVVNPLIVEGQVHGGLAQGIAQALYEEAVHDDSRDPAIRLVRRILDALGGRSAVVHHGTDRDACYRKPAGRQGSRGGGHDRVYPGRRQRCPRRGPAPRRARHRNAVFARCGSGSAIHSRPGRCADDSVESSTT